MVITPQIIADQLAAYLNHNITLAQLVDWAEQQMLDGDFESSTVRDAVAVLGLADVRTFGLTWEDCQALFQKLGFAARVEIGTASASST